jgi:hypothetical protein
LRIRGFEATAVQRLQRFTWLLSFAPHLWQRRVLSLSVNFVLGRVFMAGGAWVDVEKHWP